MSITLSSFESKWTKRISEFMTIKKNGEDCHDFEFGYEKESIFDSDEANENKGVPNLETELGKLENRDIQPVKYFGADSIKGMSDEVLSMEVSSQRPEDIKLFSCKDYGYSISIDTKKVDQSSFMDFFTEFSNIDLDSFKQTEEVTMLPETAYIQEFFSLNSAEKIQDYVIYLLMFKVECTEYLVLKNFLMMCLLLKKLMGTGNSNLNLLLKRLKLDYAMMFLRIAMLCPRSKLSQNRR